MLANETIQFHTAQSGGIAINRLNVNSHDNITTNPISKKLVDVCNFFEQIHAALNQRGLVDEAYLVHSHLQLLKTPEMLSIVSRWGLEPVLENLTNDFIVQYQPASPR